MFAHRKVFGVVNIGQREKFLEITVAQQAGSSGRRESVSRAFAKLFPDDVARMFGLASPKGFHQTSLANYNRKVSPDDALAHPVDFCF